MLKKGDTVVIHTDPITKIRVEGKAKVVKVLSSSDEGDLTEYRLSVKFGGDPDTYDRWYYEPKTKAEVKAEK